MSQLIYRRNDHWVKVWLRLHIAFDHWRSMREDQPMLRIVGLAVADEWLAASINRAIRVIVMDTETYTFDQIENIGTLVANSDESELHELFMKRVTKEKCPEWYVFGATMLNSLPPKAAAQLRHYAHEWIKAGADVAKEDILIGLVKTSIDDVYAALAGIESYLDNKALEKVLMHVYFYNGEVDRGQARVRKLIEQLSLPLRQAALDLLKTSPFLTLLRELYSEDAPS